MTLPAKTVIGLAVFVVALCFMPIAAFGASGPCLDTCCEASADTHLAVPVKCSATDASACAACGLLHASRSDSLPVGRVTLPVVSAAVPLRI